MDRIKTLAGLLMRDKLASKKLKDNEYAFYFDGIYDLIQLIERTEDVKNINHTLSTDEYLNYNSQSNQDEYAEGGGYNGFEGGK